VSPSVFVIPAAINGVLTLGVFLLSCRGVTGAIVATLAIGVGLSLFLATGSPRHSVGEAFWLVGAPVSAIVWLPGAALAVVSGRLRGVAQQATCGAAVVVSLILGAGFILMVLSLVCSRFGDCL